MKIRKATIRTAIAVILPALFALGCGGDKPEAMLASAKDYIAKNDNKAAVIQLKNALQINPSLAEARFLLGKAMLESGNPVAAEVELRKAEELKFSADQVTPLLARTQLMLGQTGKVTDELAKVPLNDPTSKADLQTTVGLAYLMGGKIDNAQTAFDAAIAARPDYGPATIGLARIRAGKQDLAGALTLLDAALEKNPKLYEAWQIKADILHAQGKRADADEGYQKALSVRPDYVPAHAALIAHFLESGKIAEAETQLEAMKKDAPGSPQASYFQARLFYQQKNFKGAQESVRQYLKLVPDSISGLQLAGAIEFELKSYATAETYLQKVLAKTPELGMARRVLILTYLRSNQPARALATLQPVLDKIDKDSSMLALAGTVYLQNGVAEKSSAYFAKAAALDPANKGKQTSVALSHLAKGDTDTAYRELEQIASSDTGINADMALIASQLRARKFDPALKSIAALEKKQPENPLVDNLRGTALLGKGDAAAARKSFEQALSRNPAYFPAAASLAALDLADKKPDEAKKRFENIVAKDPKNVQALMALAELAAKTGARVDEVAALINKAIAANPAEPSPRLALIGLYLSAKDAKKAVSAAQDALGVLPDQPELLDATGRAYMAAENTNQALTTYGKLANLLPNSPRPQLRLAEVQMAAKNKDAAMQSLRKALAIQPDSVDAQRGIMMLDLDAGRTAEALATARQIQAQRPKEAIGHALEGDVHAFKKSWTEAAAAYRTGIKKSGATELAVKLHVVLIAGGGAGEADKFADGWLKDHPTDLVFRNYLAESANNRKDYAVASKHYRALVDARPNDPLLLNNLAWTAAQIKDPKAIEYAEKAYRLAPEQAGVMDTLGYLLVEKGDMTRGLELLQKAVSLAPQVAPIRLNLAKALLKAGQKDEAKKELEELVKLGDAFNAQAEVKKLLQSL